MASTLIFVYNADSGLFNTVTDIAHKIFSPQTYACNLCALTHDYFNVRDEWKAFIAGLGTECEFLHRDQLGERYPGLDIALPAVLRAEGGSARVCLPAETINQCQDMDCLQQAIRSQCLLPRS